MPLIMTIAPESVQRYLVILASIQNRSCLRVTATSSSRTFTTSFGPKPQSCTFSIIMRATISREFGAEAIGIIYGARESVLGDGDQRQCLASCRQALENITARLWKALYNKANELGKLSLI